MQRIQEWLRWVIPRNLEHQSGCPILKSLHTIQLSWRNGREKPITIVNYRIEPGAAPGYIDRGAEYIFLWEFVRDAHARERVSARIYGWGPGARLRAPGGGPGGGAPGSSRFLGYQIPQIVICSTQTQLRYFDRLLPSPPQAWQELYMIIICMIKNNIFYIFFPEISNFLIQIRLC